MKPASVASDPVAVPVFQQGTQPESTAPHSLEEDLLIIKSNQLNIYNKNKTHLAKRNGQKVKQTFGISKQAFNIDLRDHLAQKLKRTTVEHSRYTHERVKAISELRREAGVSIFHKRNQSVASAAQIKSQGRTGTPLDGGHARKPTLDRPASHLQLLNNFRKFNQDHEQSGVVAGARIDSALGVKTSDTGVRDKLKFVLQTDIRFQTNQGSQRKNNLMKRQQSALPTSTGSFAKPKSDLSSMRMSRLGQGTVLQGHHIRNGSMEAHHYYMKDRNQSHASINMKYGQSAVLKSVQIQTQTGYASVNRTTQISARKPKGASAHSSQASFSHQANDFDRPSSSSLKALSKKQESAKQALTKQTMKMKDMNSKTSKKSIQSQVRAAQATGSLVQQPVNEYMPQPDANAERMQDLNVVGIQMEDASHESSVQWMKESPEIRVEKKKNLLSVGEEAGRMRHDHKAKEESTTKLAKVDQIQKASGLTRQDVTQETYQHDVDAQWLGVDIKVMDEVKADIEGKMKVANVDSGYDYVQKEAEASPQAQAMSTEGDVANLFQNESISPLQVHSIPRALGSQAVRYQDAAVDSFAAEAQETPQTSRYQSHKANIHDEAQSSIEQVVIIHDEVDQPYNSSIPQRPELPSQPISTRKVTHYGSRSSSVSRKGAAGKERPTDKREPLFRLRVKVGAKNTNVQVEQAATPSIVSIVEDAKINEDLKGPEVNGNYFEIQEVKTKLKPQQVANVKNRFKGNRSFHELQKFRYSRQSVIDLAGGKQSKSSSPAHGNTVQPPDKHSEYQSRGKSPQRDNNAKASINLRSLSSKFRTFIDTAPKTQNAIDEDNRRSEYEKEMNNFQTKQKAIMEYEKQLKGQGAQPAAQVLEGKQRSGLVLKASASPQRSMLMSEAAQMEPQNQFKQTDSLCHAERAEHGHVHLQKHQAIDDFAHSLQSMFGIQVTSGWLSNELQKYKASSCAELAGTQGQLRNPEQHNKPEAAGHRHKNESKGKHLTKAPHEHHGEETKKLKQKSEMSKDGIYQILKPSYQRPTKTGAMRKTINYVPLKFVMKNGDDDMIVLDDPDSDILGDVMVRAACQLVVPQTPQRYHPKHLKLKLMQLSLKLGIDDLMGISQAKQQLEKHNHEENKPRTHSAEEESTDEEPNESIHDKHQRLQHLCASSLIEFGLPINFIIRQRVASKDFRQRKQSDQHELAEFRPQRIDIYLTSEPKVYPSKQHNQLHKVIQFHKGAYSGDFEKNPTYQFRIEASTMAMKSSKISMVIEGSKICELEILVELTQSMELDVDGVLAPGEIKSLKARGGYDYDDGRKLEAELKSFLEMNRPRYGAQSSGPVDFIGKNREEVWNDPLHPEYLAYQKAVQHKEKQLWAQQRRFELSTTKQLQQEQDRVKWAVYRQERENHYDKAERLIKNASRIKLIVGLITQAKMLEQLQGNVKLWRQRNSRKFAEALLALRMSHQFRRQFHKNWGTDFAVRTAKHIQRSFSLMGAAFMGSEARHTKAKVMIHDLLARLSFIKKSTTLIMQYLTAAGCLKSSLQERNSIAAERRNLQLSKFDKEMQYILWFYKKAQNHQGLKKEKGKKKKDKNQSAGSTAKMMNVYVNKLMDFKELVAEGDAQTIETRKSHVEQLCQRARLDYLLDYSIWVFARDREELKKIHVDKDLTIYQQNALRYDLVAKQKRSIENFHQQMVALSDLEQDLFKGTSNVDRDSTYLINPQFEREMIQEKLKNKLLKFGNRSNTVALKAGQAHEHIPTPAQIKEKKDVSLTKSKSSPKKKSKGATKEASKSPEAVKAMKIQFQKAKAGTLPVDKKGSPSKLSLGLTGTDASTVLDDGGFKGAEKREGRTMLIHRLIEEFRVEYDGQSPRASPDELDHEIMSDLLSPYTRIGKKFPPFVCLVPRVDMQRVVCKCADFADAEQCLSPEPRLKQRQLKGDNQR